MTFKRRIRSVIPASVGILLISGIVMAQLQGRSNQGSAVLGSEAEDSLRAVRDLLRSGNAAVDV